MKRLICTFACFLVAALSADIVPGWKDLPAEKIRPERDNTPAVRTAPGKFTFSADFSVLKDERACWDIPIRMDLSEKKRVLTRFLLQGDDFRFGIQRISEKRQRMVQRRLRTVA